MRMETCSRFVFFVCALTASPVVLAVGQNEFRISSDSGRPLATVAEEIQERFGVIVTYEDPAYLFSGDWTDVTASVRRDGKLTPRVLVPRQRKVEFMYPIERTMPNDQEVNLLLASALRESSQAGHPGEFRIERTAGDYRVNEATAYHLIPTGMKGRSGARQAYVPLLDTRISLPWQESDGIDALSRLVQAVTKQSGRKLEMGVAPMNGLGRATVRLSATNEPARDVLWRTLKAVAPNLSWMLLCDPGEGAACALNIVGVPRKQK